MIDVVMGVIFSEEGKLLIAKRNKYKHFGGLWELPGGKREDSESIRSALIRELQEELGVDVDVVDQLEPYQYEQDGLSIRFFPLFAKIIGGVVTNKEHEQIEYVEVDEFEGYEFAPPDYKALDMIKQKMRVGLIA